MRWYFEEKRPLPDNAAESALCLHVHLPLHFCLTLIPDKALQTLEVAYP